MQKKLIPFLIGGLLLWAMLAGCASFPARPQTAPGPAPETYSKEAAYHYSLAVLSRLDGRPAESIDHMKRALAFAPGSPYLNTELVSLYVENGDVDQALALGEALLPTQPGNIELRSIMGGLYFNLREYDKAIRQYRTVTEMDPANTVAYLYLATIYSQEKKYDEAEQAYRKLLALDPDHIIGMFYYAKTLSQMDRAADAERLYQKIISQRPAFEAAWTGLAALYESRNRYDEAIGVYRRYLEIHPARIGIRVKIAELQMKANRAEAAEKDLREVLKINPDSREVLIALGLLYYDMRRYDEAADRFLLLLEKTPGDDKLRYLLASVLEQKGDRPKALVEYQKISPKFELYANAQIQAAKLMKMEGDSTGAVGVIRRAIGQRKDQAVLYLYLSSLYEENKDMAAAERTVREGIGLFPRDTDLHYLLGVLLEKTGRFEESIQSMKQVLVIDPGNADALNFIGYSYADRGIHLDEAEQMIAQALKIKPDNGYILDSMGWVHFKKNNHESALTYLKKALEFLPEDPSIMEHLGDVYFEAGRREEALEWYRKAMKKDPDNRRLKNKMELLKP
ncbi:MAG TPA: tetratricopeptide repeat protein [Smithellaceae bacterium]|nr:tetratricopeptide repeat protein [Smithellaceae bacterium]